MAARQFDSDFLALGLNAADTLIRLPHFPEHDSKVEIISTHLLPGGQAATAAVACHRWGLRARYAGKIGDDWAGRFHRRVFAREGIPVHLAEVPGCPSQLAYILIDQPSGERTILWQHDSRLDLSAADLPADWIRSTRLLHVDGHPPAPAALAAQWAHQAGGMVSADLDNIYPGVEQLLGHVDFLICSRQFPARLTGIHNLPEALKEISRRFACRVTGATLGRQGALAFDGDQFHYSPAFCVNAVDTTGAGDVFHAGFAYALLDGRPLGKILEFACAAAALNCTEIGARGGIKPLREIEHLAETGSRHASLYPPKFL